MFDRADSKTVVPHHDVAVATGDVGSRRVGSLIGQCVALEKAIEPFLAAIEPVYIVICRELLDSIEPGPGQSRTPASDNSRANRGLCSTGRSRIS